MSPCRRGRRGRRVLRVVLRLAQLLVQDEAHALFDLRVCRKVVRSAAGPPRHRATAEAAAAMARDATDATHARDVAMAAGSRKRQFGLLKPRAAPCRACSASSRSSGRRAPPSPSPATSSGWLNLEWPGGRPAWAARCRVQLKGACGHGRGPGYPARLRQQVGTFLVGLDCLERVRRVRLQPAHRRTGTGTSWWRAECWHSAESSHPVLISS